MQNMLIELDDLFKKNYMQVLCLLFILYSRNRFACPFGLKRLTLKVVLAVNLFLYVFRFMPALNTGTAEIMIFINDDEDKNEETFCVKVNYISENDED